MIDEITKNVTTATHILSNIGLIFLMMVTAHFMGPQAYLTPFALKVVPCWFIGLGVGYCFNQLYKYYFKKDDAKIE